ncbi:MAG: hypothetical protein LZF85_12050 [Nitrosomonas sp.]|uniref:beta strand repeat-containing protein n=1 Tax=Nitrosomonas sp. TaxID=42353 RepID=UPI0025D347FE|nr:hypothetical protein [Nitrosomonas sp.]UJP02482.1 MAG: hypothetical protein LZF85_12050 [Nitrosomonas sp.]
MAISDTQKADILKVVAGLFNAAPGGYQSELENFISNGGTVQQLSHELSLNPIFISSVLAGSNTVGDKVNILMNHFGVAADSSSTSAGSQAHAYFQARLEHGDNIGDIVYDAVTFLSATTDPAFAGAKNLLDNKAKVADAFSKVSDSTDFNALKNILSTVTGAAPYTDADVANIFNGIKFDLTNGTDIATANVFNSGLVYNPAGTDRINALQSEDNLTGVGTNPTLNATLGNANDNGASSITPTLSNIQAINLDITGNTNTLDVRFADSLQTLSVNKLTAEATNGITIQNINQPAANLTAKNSAAVDNSVNFLYSDGVLDGTTAGGDAETGNLTISNLQADPLQVGNSAATQGFENLTLNATSTNLIKAFKATDLENLTVKGSGSLTILNTIAHTDGTQFKAGGLDIGNGLGVRGIDAGGFTGTANIDISPAVGGHADPADSGSKYYTTIKGGTGDDAFWTNTALAADSATLRDTLDGGTGANRLIAIDAGVVKTGKNLPSITNVQTLDLRLQAGATETAYVTAFDSTLTTVNLRNEQKWDGAASVNGTFNLREVGATLAAGGINLLHASGAGATGKGTDTAAVDTVNIRLADATGSGDTVVLNVNSDLNTSSSYDYAIGLEVEKDSGGNYKGWVENLTVNDNDKESNTVTGITGNDSKGNTTALGLTGTVTFKGGVAGNSYTVDPVLNAKTVDASGQASDVSLKVGNPLDSNNYGTTVLAQTVKLGTGNDTLTMDGLDVLNGNDTVTDAGGTDTLRALFSKDVTGTLTLDAIEKFQIAATNNAAVDMVKVTGLTELALLSDFAINNNNEVFTTGVTPGQVSVTDIITLSNTTLNTVNFFGDQDGTDVDGGDSNNIDDSGAYTQTFNGLTLSNNTGATVTMAISAPLNNIGATESDPGDGDGIKAYNLGKLTTHGVSTLNITVSNEYSEDGTTVKATDAKTTINNIFDKDLVTFTAIAKGSLDVGTVSGNATGNNIKTFDVSAVGGNFTGDVLALGDAATVTLAAGDNDFSALGSAGKGVVINSFAGKDDIEGTAQSDTFNAGAGNDTIRGDRGDNVISAGSGDDTVEAKDGNNTVSFGTGVNEIATINLNTGLDGSKSTNVFTLDGSVALVNIDSNGDNTLDVIKVLAVGSGSSLRVDWTGSTLNESTALLDGSKAVTGAGAAYNGDANANFVIAGAGEATTFTGGAGNDVLIKTDAAAVTFSGGAGNDAFVGNKTVANDVTGGAGADIAVLADDGTKVANATAAVVHIADGDSTASAYDQVYGYNTAAAATNTLDLVFTNIQANTAGTDGSDVNNVKSHAITSGVVTFDDIDAFGGAVAVGTGENQLSLSDVLSYLSSNLNGTSATVGFAYDGNGDGDTTDTVDSFFIYQDGASDTVVQLVGVQAANGANIAAVGTAAGADTIVIS